MELMTVIVPQMPIPCQQGVCGGAGLLLGDAGHQLDSARLLLDSAVLLLGGAGHLPDGAAGSRYGARGLPGLARGQPGGDNELLYSYILLLTPFTLKKQQRHGTH